MAHPGRGAAPSAYHAAQTRRRPLGTADVVAVTTITGDAICRSTNVDYRLDSASARGPLRSYGTPP